MMRDVRRSEEEEEVGKSGGERATLCGAGSTRLKNLRGSPSVISVSASSTNRAKSIRDFHQYIIAQLRPTTIQFNLHNLKKD